MRVLLRFRSWLDQSTPDDKIDEVSDKIPSSIVNADNEPIYNTIYNLKSSMAEPQIKWTAEDVTKFVQSGGNFFTTFAISENIWMNLVWKWLKEKSTLIRLPPKTLTWIINMLLLHLKIDLKMTNDINRVLN